jgi:D-alanyl-D-alanine carboxypeptidase
MHSHTHSKIVLTPLVHQQYLASQALGLQYLVVNAHKTFYTYINGWADYQQRSPMRARTTMMGYSMTKTFTAVAILQLVGVGSLGLDDDIDIVLPKHPYAGQRITVRQLLCHTSGLPNPIPLRWVHLAEEHAQFDEEAALAKVLHKHSSLKSKPGQTYAYSNTGYWLLGKIIERISGHTYTDYMVQHILLPLGLSEGDLGFEITNPALHSKGYLAKYSALNLLKAWVTDSKLWGPYEGDWLTLKNHYANGPAFGGLVGTAHGFAQLLQDQLRQSSVLLSFQNQQLLQNQQTTSRGALVPMTLGWHIGHKNDMPYLFKEGGGGGFHSEMRLYPQLGIGTIVMANSTTFNSTRFLNHTDNVFF